jgi:hypothetical protein
MRRPCRTGAGCSTDYPGSLRRRPPLRTEGQEGVLTEGSEKPQAARAGRGCLCAAEFQATGHLRCLSPKSQCLLHGRWAAGRRALPHRGRSTALIASSRTTLPASPWSRQPPSRLSAPRHLFAAGSNSVLRTNNTSSPQSSKPMRRRVPHPYGDLACAVSGRWEGHKGRPGWAAAVWCGRLAAGTLPSGRCRSW